jgi:hypothetical protein
MSSAGLSFAAASAKTDAMEQKPGSPPAPAGPSREERLAARLRENLKRRKAQARALSDSAGPDSPGQILPSRLREGNGLPKSPPKS